jgi:excisionase family DNA binding protein
MSQPSTQPKKKKRGPRKQRAIQPVCVSVDEWVRATGFSRPTTYRWMADGRLRFVQFGERMRKIPTSEYVRLGLSGDAA